MAELSVASGLPVPTIKYYLREGLLPAGTRTGPNRAEYDGDHLHRLRLIRALVEVGDLPLATVRSILTAIDDPTLPMHSVLGVAHRALALRGAEPDPSPELDAARAELDAFLERLGWRVGHDAPARAELAQALATLRQLGWSVDARVFARYARAADRLAAWELEQTPSDTTRERTVERAVVGTVIFEAALVALRRLAQEHHSAARFAGPSPAEAGQDSGNG
jgi:DNA-binding transcriptional MerR regulator